MNTQKEAHQRIHTSWEEGAGPKELASGRRQACQLRVSEHRAAPKHWSMSPLGVCAQVSQNSGSKSRVPSLPHGGRSVTKSCPTLVTPWTQPTRLLCPWDFLAKNTGVGCHFLLQGVFPIHGSNLGLLHHRQILY